MARGGGQEKAVENVGRVPARHCHFHRLAAFPRLFLLLSRRSLPSSPSIAAREASGNENTLLFIHRKAYAAPVVRLDVSVVRYVGGHGRTR